MRRWQPIILVALDAILLTVAYVGAFWLRLGRERALDYAPTIVRTLPVVIAISVAVHWWQGLYAGILRYASISTARAVARAVVYSGLIVCLVLFLLFRLEGIPRTTFPIYGMGALLLIGASRLSVRLVRGEASFPSDGTRVLLYGGGDTAELVLRGLRQTPGLGYRVLGILDDDERKHGLEIHGCRIRPGIEGHESLPFADQVDELWISTPKLPGERLRRLYNFAQPRGIRVKILPPLDHALLGEDIARFQEPNISDLLRRPPRELDRERMRKWLRGRRILITGAGGSIGSELVRQLAELECGLLVLCDASEANLFEIEQEITRLPHRPQTAPYLVDVRDAEAVRRMVSAMRPEIVFHAAAYKHVPLVELNPCEGVRNNVEGLWNVARAAIEQSVGEFVFISTDKAVRPSNVMGATKRLGETLVQVLNRESSTRFCAVRFGNVLGSSGSVVPIFKGQIRRGGPVTVTHRDMTRYFMLASEAAQLVIQAGSILEGGEVFVLDMGDPVRIADMARDLIRLMGKEPEREIAIEYTGLRPGEKIREELLIGEEDAKTSFDDIWIDGAPLPGISLAELEKELAALFADASAGDFGGTLARLARLEPEFEARYGRTRAAIDGAQSHLEGKSLGRLQVRRTIGKTPPKHPIETETLS